MTPVTEQTSARLEAAFLRQPNRPADYTAPLPASVIGRGTDAMTADEVDALYPDEQTGSAR